MIDQNKYLMKASERVLELLKIKPKTREEQALIDLEIMLLDIRPYSKAWRWGYRKSLIIAMKAIKKQIKIKSLTAVKQNDLL